MRNDANSVGSSSSRDLSDRKNTATSRDVANHRTFNRGRPKHPEDPDLGLCDGVVSTRILQALYSASAEYSTLGVPYVAIGGIAVGAYGAPRATKDVDFLVGEEAFEHHGPLVSFRPGLPISSGGVAVDPVSIGHDEDFLLETFDRPAMSRGVPVIGLAPLVYLKLRAGRHQDFADVTRLLEAGIDERPVHQYLRKHAPDLISKFERCRQEEP